MKAIDVKAGAHLRIDGFMATVIATEFNATKGHAALVKLTYRRDAAHSHYPLEFTKSFRPDEVVK
jgi:hypothetical protein